MSKKNLILLANYFCVNEEWLATGEGDRNAPGITNDSLIHDGSLCSRLIKVANFFWGEQDDSDPYYQTISISIDLMAASTRIEASRLYKIIYEKHYPFYTEVISLLKTTPQLNANWLFCGQGEMINKPTTASLDIDRIATLVDTIATLQKTISEKDKTIAILTDQNQQLKNQII